MEDLVAGWRTRGTPSELSPFEVTVTTGGGSKGEVTIRVVPKDSRVRTFTLRAENLALDRPTKTVTVRAGLPTTLEWKTRATPDAPWVAVVIPDGDVSRRREVRTQ
jgi:hypothetical protein